MKSNNEGPPQAAAKKTRDLSNVSECHSCHLRVDIATAAAKTKLQILYSEWRIVLLCKKCFSRVESSELCSYCFAASSGDSFTCRQCNRRVHRHCDSEYRSVRLLSDSSCSAAEVSVCADCWVPGSLARWRGAVRSRKRRRSGKDSCSLRWGKYRASAMVAGTKTIRRNDDVEDDDEDDDEDDEEDDDDEEEDEKSCSLNVSVCVCDSSTAADGGCLKVDIEEVNGDDDGRLKEGEGSCSNGGGAVELESPEECVCITTTAKDQRGNGKLDPFYFKYRKRSTVVNRCVLTYKRRKPNSVKKLNACSLLTYKRRKPRKVYASYVFTYKRRRPRILYACSTGSS